MTIASAAYRESMRQPAALVTLLAALSIIVLSPNLGIFDLGEEHKMAVDASLTAALLAGLFTILFAASQTVSAELQSRTALTLLAKPVSWETFLLGKFLGVAGAGITALLILAMPVLFMARLAGDRTVERSFLVAPSASQDAEVSSASPDEVLPEGEVLRVYRDAESGKERIVYLLFDLSMPHQRSVHSATLRLRWLGPDEVGDDTATNAKGVRIFAVHDTVWSEETLTWRSRPPLDRTVAILSAPGPSREHEIPVLRHAAGRRMLALALKARGPVNAHFGGTKSDPDRRLTLELLYYAPADPTAPFVLVGALFAWLGLGLLLARNKSRSPYAAAAWSYAAACLAALVLLSAKGPLVPLGLSVAGWDWRLLQALCLNSMEIVVLAAVGVAVAARAGRVWTFIGTLVVFTAGHVAGHWAARLAGGTPSGWRAAAVSVLPNLEHFNLGDRIASGEVLPASLLGMAALYMLLYTLAVLLVGMALIRGREVK